MYLFYSVKRRTFYEWKPLVEAAEAHLNDSSGRLESYWQLPSSSSQPSSSRWSIAAINQVIHTHRAALAAHCWFLTACSMPQVLYEDWQMEVRTLQYTDELTAEWQDREYGEDTAADGNSCGSLPKRPTQVCSQTAYTSRTTSSPCRTTGCLRMNQFCSMTCSFWDRTTSLCAAL
jgi:hypothetical protein